MNIVRHCFTKIASILFSVRGTGRSIALSFAFVCVASQVYAQDEKKISYPVDIQIQRAPVSSAPENKSPTAQQTSIQQKAPIQQTQQPEQKQQAPKSQEDAIRSLYESASTSTARKTTKQRTDKTTAKSAKATEKKAVSKSSTKAATNKKIVAAKPEQKISTQKNTATTLSASSTSTVKNSIIADSNQPPTPTESLSPVKAAATSVLPVAVETVLSNPDVIKNNAVVSATNEQVLDDDDELAAGVTTENVITDGTSTIVSAIENVAAKIEGTAPESDSVPVQPASADPTQGAPAAPVVAAVKNIPLPMSNEREAFVTQFKQFVEAKVAPRVPGVAIAIITEGKVKVLQAYGVKKVGGRDFIDTDTAFRLASVSKTIAGTTAGILVNDGVMSWTTPVVSVLPNIQFSNPRYGNQISLRDILSQSTGLPTHSGDNYIEEGLPFDLVVQRLKSVNFICPPGKCYGYQNVSFSLFDGMVRNKTGKPYEQYVQEKLFNPLGMQTASFGLAGLKAHNNFALPHVATSKGWSTEKITENYYRMHPAAGANASITDMARWVLAQLGKNPEVLSPKVLNAVHDKVTKNTATQSHYGAREGVTDTHYGIGWRVFDYRGDKNFLHHGGYVLGFQSQMVFNKELQIGMVALSNSNRMPTNIIFEFLDAYEDEKRGPRKILPSIAPLAKKRPAQKGR